MATVHRPRLLAHQRTVAAVVLLLLCCLGTGGAAAAAAATAAAAAAGETGSYCGAAARGRRALRQAVGNTTAAAAASAPPTSPKASVSSDSSLVVSELALVNQSCTSVPNSYFDSGAAGVTALVAPASNLQASEGACCASCSQDPRCNVWQWCPEPQGCKLLVVGNTSVYASDSAGNGSYVSAPYQGCQLLDTTVYLHGSINLGILKTQGPSVPFVAGSLWVFDVPGLSGFEVAVGHNFAGKFNYPCAASQVADACVVVGSAQEVGQACMDDPACVAFSFRPTGRNGSSAGNSSYGTLKGGGNITLSMANTELNPDAAAYVKLDQKLIAAVPADGAAPAPGSTGEGGGSNAATVGAVVGAVVGAAVVAAAAALAYVMVRKRRLRRAAPAAADVAAKPGGDAESALKIGAAAVVGGDGPQGGSAISDDSSPTTLGCGLSLESDGSQEQPPQQQQQQQQQQGAGGGEGLALAPLPDGSMRAGSGGGSPPATSVRNGYPSASGGSGGSGGSGESFSPFMELTPEQLQYQQQYQHVQHQLRQQVAASVASGGGDDQHATVVVEVQRAVPGGSGASSGGRGALPLSLQQAGTARELLEVFARMYAQRPAVDYAVVAQMLDQELDPAAVEAAEARDELERQRQQQRFGSGSSGGGSSLATAQQSLLPGMADGSGSSLPPPTPSLEWSMQPEEVEICRRPDGSFWQLGTGAFGTCYKGLFHGQQLVAVKVLHRVEERRQPPRGTPTPDHLEREVLLLKGLAHRNVVTFIGAALGGPAPMLVTEFCEFGDLWRALPLTNAVGQRIFAWDKRGRRVMCDVACGLDYLHRQRVVHLDLKSANILLSRHGTAKICDCGMARVLGASREYLSMVSGVMGTFAWSAPEVLAGRRCSEKVDLYSLGVVLWEVCTGEVPVRGEMRPLVAPADCPAQVVELYERCTAESPDQRPSAAEVAQLLEALL